MLERTDAVTNEVLESITFVLAYLIVLAFCESYSGGQTPKKASATNTKFNRVNIRDENP